MISCFKILILFFLLLPAVASAQSISQIKKEKEKTEKEISYLNKLLEEAKASKSASIGKLNILRQKITECKKMLNTLNNEVAYLEKNIASNEARIDELTKTRNTMLDLYSKLIYGTWKKRNKMNKLMFIFSSSDFNQAYSRYKYFEQIQEYSKGQLRLIQQLNDSLTDRNLEMKKFIDLKNNTLNDINSKNKDLISEQNNENLYVKELQKKEKEITNKLKAEQKNRDKLTNDLNRLIAAQVKKSGSSSKSYKLTPEEQLISDDFAKNKGKLPWPVTQGFISEKFGLNTHPVYKRVEMVNDGVSITTSVNSDIRCVFDGVVSELMFAPGFNNVVLIRHGSYLTLYTNLVDITVKKGQKVKTKEIIGKVAHDSDKGSVLNFQVWKDMIKLDPELWLAK